ncbi:tyrosine-protein phosphatase [Bacillus taeanensis]|uniref:Tyrosine-protein phosphatase n=1 Tax=Bacillus taeanensis TaxID=273032 RepID=A0A366XXN7_9BACI|nr:CpsB/CapC family capsule biosynthesis tyrosine phosphatase [Bacillus taeanensis]RBW68893.1 tyrosine protein phosphatase [Bacillus taeanensis]
MIDIHCHILPGVDDGAQHEAASVDMAKAAAAQGITHIIATPHHKNREWDNDKSSILQAVSHLNKLLQEQQIPLTVLPGQETRIYGEMVADYAAGKLLTLNDTGKYIFVEFPSNHVPRYTNQLLFDLQLKGLTPIIVHPERNTEIIEHPDVLYKFVKDGALTQVTASSVTGDLGKKIQKFSNQLIEHRLTHFVASDAHNTSTRPFRLRGSYDLIEKQFGVDVRYMFQENTELLVEGKNVFVDVPERIKRKKFLGLF